MNYTRPNITEGPWRLSEENNVWSDNGERIANVCQPPHESPEANARAISALPQLLEALMQALEVLEMKSYRDGKPNWNIETRRKAQAALTAAGYSFQ